MGKRLGVSPALIAGVVGNLLALGWPAPLFFVPKGTYDEELLSLGFALVSLVVLGIGVGGCVLSLLRGSLGERVSGIVGLLLCLLPMPLYINAAVHTRYQRSVQFVWLLQQRQLR
jgi:hypothetical protein